METSLYPDDWPFLDAKNTAVITIRSIVKDKNPVLHVTHDEHDGGWQFLDLNDADMNEAMVVSLELMVRRDSSIAELADLPLGWHAWRESPDAEWQRSPQPED